MKRTPKPYWNQPLWIGFVLSLLVILALKIFLGLSLDFYTSCFFKPVDWAFNHWGLKDRPEITGQLTFFLVILLEVLIAAVFVWLGTKTAKYVWGHSPNKVQKSILWGLQGLCTLLILIVLSRVGLDRYRAHKAADLERFHAMAFQQILEGLMPEHFKSGYNKELTNADKKKSEVDWVDGSLRGHPLSLAQVVVGGRLFVGACCGAWGYLPMETRYYSVEKQGDRLRILLYFREPSSLGQTNFVTPKGLSENHLEAMVHSMDNDHYFYWNEEKGFTEVLTCPYGQEYVDQSPQPTCLESTNSEVFPEGDGKLKVIIHYHKCVEPEKYEVDQFGQEIYVDKDFPKTKHYQWDPVTNRYLEEAGWK